MARHKRTKVMNGTHFVYIYGLNELMIFKAITDKAKFIQLLEKNGVLYHINIYSYKFTNNSVEIMLHDAKGNLSEFIKCVKGTYCQHYYNEKYNRRGTIYKDRFKSKYVGNKISTYLVTNILNKNLTLNDGNLNNFNLEPSIVFDMVKEHFEIDGLTLLYDKDLYHNQNKMSAISILVFSLRSFCGCIHKNISELLNGISETMSSTLSLNGLDLILKDKYKWFYFKLLMLVYKDEVNFMNF